MQRNPLPAKAARRLAELAAEVTRHVDQAVAEGHPADVTLAAYFRERRELGARDRRFLSDLVFSYYRWKGWAGGPSEAALVASCLLDASDLHPALERLAQRAGLSDDPRPLGRATLDEKAAAAARWLGQARPQSVESLVPRWFRDALFTPPGTDPGEHLARCIASLQQRPPTWLRLSRGREQGVLDEVARAGISVVSQFGPAVAVGASSALNALSAAARSQFEVQDLASQCVGWLCSPAPGQRWWDVCAGAGGKALHLADLMQDRGRLVATDVRPPALSELRRRAKRAGLTSIQTSETQDLPRGLFDGVLVDAPCSNTGTWSRNPDARWRTGEAEVRKKAKAQAALLRRAAVAVKPGGVLVYSVCAVTTAETVGVIEPFLNERPEFLPETMVHPLRKTGERGVIWIWPWEGPCDGMFIARMRRQAL